MEEIIQAMDLSYQYMNEDEESVLVLDHLNITVPKGQFLSVLGHNGSGKSTFAKHLNAILLPCGGKVYVAGLDTSCEEKTLEVRRNVGISYRHHSVCKATLSTQLCISIAIVIGPTPPGTGVI